MIRRFTRKEDEAEDDEPPPGHDDRLLTADAGLNRLEWDLRYPSVERFEKLVLWNDYLDGPRVVPGRYTARLQVNDSSEQVTIEVLPDPRSEATGEELQRQFEFTWAINQKLTETHRAITRLRSARKQVTAIAGRVEGQDEFMPISDQAGALVSQLDDIEEALYQTRLEARQDPLNFPIRLNDKLAGVMLNASIGDHAPSDAAIAVRDELVAAIDVQLDRLDRVISEELDAFNRQVAELELPAVHAE